MKKAGLAIVAVIAMLATSPGAATAASAPASSVKASAVAQRDFDGPNARALGFWDQFCERFPQWC